jgi:RecA-family ATPase
MIPSLAQIAQLLGGEVSAGQVRAPAPGHSPADRGMSIKLSAGAPDGFIVHLFNDGGDDVAAKDYVRSKLGLAPWQPNGKGNGHMSPEQEMSRAIAGLRKQRSDSPPRVVATYRYVGDDGELVYEVQRLEPKAFRQRRPVAGGGYAYTLGDVKPVLYRLPQLLGFPEATVFVVEGEKDADRLGEEELVATTISGSTIWTPELADPLRGHDVIVLADNDAPGIAKAEKAALALHEIAASVRLVLLPGLPDKGDVSDYLDAGHSREDLIQVCLAAPVWQPKNEAAAEQAETAAPLVWVDMSSWDSTPLPDRQWAILDRVPAKQAGLFSGEGGTGKSIIELMKNVAHVAGKDWLGSMPEQGPAFYLGAEDDVDEIHIRLCAIAKHYGVTFKELVDGGLHILPLLGKDATLGAMTRGGKIETTDLYRQIREAAGDIKPKNISIDTLSRAFAGSEIDRVQVYAFCNHMQALAMLTGGSVTVLSHPSLAGIASGSGLSGSTAWHGAFRFRQYLKGAKANDGEQPDDDLRELEFKKNQYGRRGETMVLRYQRGLFLPEGSGASLDRLARAAKAEQVFVDLLCRFTNQDRNVSDKRTSPNYAPTEFAREDEAKKFTLKKFDLELAMRSLFKADKITVDSYGRPSRPQTRIVLKEQHP